MSKDMTRQYNRIQAKARQDKTIQDSATYEYIIQYMSL